MPQSIGSACRSQNFIHHVRSSFDDVVFDNLPSNTFLLSYWLPAFLDHEYIALRFVKQAAYEQAAPMTVSPPPNVIVRVFMIFKGVKSDDVSAWPSAQARVQDDVARWGQVVGLPEDDQLQDKSLFRVLEWGGMEVLL